MWPPSPDPRWHSTGKAERRPRVGAALARQAYLRGVPDLISETELGALAAGFAAALACFFLLPILSPMSGS